MTNDNTRSTRHVFAAANYRVSHIWYKRLDRIRLIPTVACLLILAGCAHLATEKVQAFIDCLEIGMTVSQLEERCVPMLPRVQGLDVYIPDDGWLVTPKMLSEICALTPRTCTPRDLVQRLSKAPKSPGGDLLISDPSHRFARYGSGFLGLGLGYVQRIQIFYDKDTNRVIGWMSGGERPVYKKK